MNLQILIIPFLLTIYLLGMFALFAFYSYYKKLGNIKKLEEQAVEKSQSIMQHAELKSEAILQKVEKKADEILTHSELFKGDLEKTFQKSLDDSAQAYLKLLQEHSRQFVTDYEKLLGQMKDQSLRQASESLKHIEQEAVKGLNESKATLDRGVQDALTQARTQIEEYKKRQIQEVDLNIDSLVVKLAKDLLRMNISPKDHKKFIVQALDKAKEEGMFFL